MREHDEDSAAWIASKVLKSQVKELLKTAYFPDQIVLAFLAVAYDLFRTDAADRPHFDPVEMFHKLARGTAREFEKLREPVSVKAQRPAAKRKAGRHKR